MADFLNRVRAWLAAQDWANKKNRMYAAAAIAIVGAILGLTVASAFLWLTVVSQGYLLAFGSADDWR